MNLPASGRKKRSLAAFGLSRLLVDVNIFGLHPHDAAIEPGGHRVADCLVKASCVVPVLE